MSAAAKTLPASHTHPQNPRAVDSLLPPPRCPPEKHIVHWFRKGLRLHDNPALREGLHNAKTFRCVFIIDPWFASSSNVGINKWRFLLQCLEDLDSSLKKLDSRLFVVRGQPADALPKLFREWGTTALTFEEDPEPYGRVRDHNIMSKCREVGIAVISRVSHTLYKLDQIIERNGGKAPLTYHQFQALIASLPPPKQAEPTITKQTLNGAITPITDDHNDRFGVPTLEELGFETEALKSPVWVGGEMEALDRLERHLERKAWVATFGRPKMTPQSLLASQTGLSPYLRFGCLSTRLFYYKLTELYKKIKRVRPPLSLHGQILWREFFYCAATRNPNFDRMVGNPICVQIPWVKNREALSKWANGQTGFPWIDAIMIQLREEGWIHHLARHAVACFLTRGDLWISWEEGMKVFDELLLDADWSVNAGMWMWLSCSSFFQQFFHCYCPVRFGRKTDPNGDFIRKYIPALKNMPTQYIHQPWVAPESVQQSSQCIIGRDYPLPIVDHESVSRINIERVKQVYAQLARYKPRAMVNQNAVQRPNAMQSSPSPTSVITSINQSNYLCSQGPDKSNTLPISSYKDTINDRYKNPEILQNSQKNEVPNESVKQTSLKEVVIVQSKNSGDSREHHPTYYMEPQKNYVITGQADCYKNVKPDTMQTPNKQENYDLENFVINNYNYTQGYTNMQSSTIGGTSNYNQQTIKVANYNDDKPIYYIPKNYSRPEECIHIVNTEGNMAQNFLIPQIPRVHDNDYTCKSRQSLQNKNHSSHIPATQTELNDFFANNDDKSNNHGSSSNNQEQ